MYLIEYIESRRNNSRTGSAGAWSDGEVTNYGLTEVPKQIENSEKNPPFIRRSAPGAIPPTPPARQRFPVG